MSLCRGSGLSSYLQFYNLEVMAIKSNVKREKKTKKKPNEMKVGVALRLKRPQTQSVSVEMRTFGEIYWVDV